MENRTRGGGPPEDGQNMSRAAKKQALDPAVAGVAAAVRGCGAHYAESRAGTLPNSGGSGRSYSE